MTKDKLKTDSEKKVSDTDAILDAVKELTKTVADLAGKINKMNETHEKWVKAGKF